jgi:hypothetical protein
MQISMSSGPLVPELNYIIIVPAHIVYNHAIRREEKLSDKPT